MPSAQTGPVRRLPVCGAAKSIPKLQVPHTASAQRSKHLLCHQPLEVGFSSIFTRRTNFFWLVQSFFPSCVPSARRLTQGARGLGSFEAAAICPNLFLPTVLRTPHEFPEPFDFEMSLLYLILEAWEVSWN